MKDLDLTSFYKLLIFINHSMIIIITNIINKAQGNCNLMKIKNAYLIFFSKMPFFFENVIFVKLIRRQQSEVIFLNNKHFFVAITTH